MSNVVICRPDLFPLRRILHCPTCKRRRRMAILDSAWYGPTVTCCACGDSWSDWERHPRPFRRGWRKEAATGARKTWDAAGQYTRADWSAWLADQVGGAA
jgi:hypothetical protein